MSRSLEISRRAAAGISETVINFTNAVKRAATRGSIRLGLAAIVALPFVPSAGPAHSEGVTGSMPVVVERVCAKDPWGGTSQTAWMRVSRADGLPLSHETDVTVLGPSMDLNKYSVTYLSKSEPSSSGAADAGISYDLLNERGQGRYLNDEERLIRVLKGKLPSGIKQVGIRDYKAFAEHEELYAGQAEQCFSDGETFWFDSSIITPIDPSPQP